MSQLSHSFFEPFEIKRLRCKPLKQDERSREADQDHLDDQVYKLHILRAMAKYKVLRIQLLCESYFTSRPCYIMACYCTVGEQLQSGVGRQGLTNRQDSTLSFASISNFGWRKESILNLASVASIDRQSTKHSLIDPSHKSFRPEADCQLHYECNDPISRYISALSSSFHCC